MMKIKTSRKISLIFSVFTFFIWFFLIILVNSISFINWHKWEEKEIRHFENNSIEQSLFINNQLESIELELFFLFCVTFFSYLLSKYIFSKIILKDIIYISDRLKNIDLNSIEKIELDLNKKDEINIIVNKVNDFLEIIDKNNKSLKQFNSQVAHELKTPLMIISSELEYLTISWNNESDYSKIEKQIDILNELIETFLFISKIENFKWDIKKDDINIYEIIKDKIENLNIIYNEKNIKVIENINKNIKLKTNKKLLDVLIKNILDNAFKYNLVWWSIQIILSEESLTIKDNGIGIDKENLSKIFDSFYRVDENKKWYWVWLNIVKKIADILWYKIEVKSEKNKATEFKIIF